ncbi:MAG: CoA transferase, partial [Gammaproteobacteria bacterium]
AHWVALLKSKVPVAPVYDLQQALDSPYVQDIGMIRPASHPVGGDMRFLGSPFKVNGQRAEAACCPQPGTDADKLLGELGLSAEKIRQLKQDGVV